MIRIYVFWFIGLILLTLAGSILLPLLPNNGLGAIAPGKDFNYLLSLAQWDGGYFLDIAASGYDDTANFAFFPLYPLLIKVLGLAIRSNILPALIISNICFIFFLIRLYKYTLKISSKKVARSTVLTFLLFPTAFFGIVAYSESLFLLLTILALEAIYDRKMLKASVFTALASLTRLIGAALIISIVSSFFTRPKPLRKFSPKDILAVMLSLLGILTFSAYSQLLTGDPIKFVSVQSLWLRGISDPISTTFSYFWAFITLQGRPINDYLDFFLTIIFFVLLMLGSKKIPFAFWIFSLLTILIPTYSGTLTSMPRYLLASLGVFVIIGHYLEEKPYLKIPVWSLMLILQCFLAALFINGHWIA